MTWYQSPVFLIARDLFHLPGDLRRDRENEIRLRLYRQCIQEGRDPYTDPKLMSEDYIRNLAKSEAKERRKARCSKLLSRRR